MKALVLVQYGCLELQDVPEPSVGPEDVLIEVKACGICGSDVHGLDGSTGRRRPPLIMGHEAAGVIVEKGPRVQGWNEGDRVAFDSTIWCGQCVFCQRGQINLCRNRRVLGVACDEYRQHGAFAQRVAVPQRILYRLPDEVSFPQAALLEPLAIACHAVTRAGIRLGDSAVVVGAGMIGLLAIQWLRLSGCTKIFAVEIDPRRRQLAQQFGACAGLSPEEIDAPAEIFRRTDGLGVDLVLEAVGSEPTVALAAACVRRGGRLVLIGNLAPRVSLPLQEVVTRELTLLGSCASCGEYPVCLEMLAQSRIDVEPLISAVAPLEEGPQWFHRLRQKDSGLLKVILQP